MFIPIPINTVSSSPYYSDSTRIPEIFLSFKNISFIHLIFKSSPLDIGDNV